MAANKNNKNYITNMIRQYGDNWIAALKPEDIQRSGKRIFKEMVRGQITYEEVGNYFLDPKFLDNLINSAAYELEINTVYYNAVVFYASYFPATPNIGVHSNHLQILCNIYSIILQRLNMVKETGNIGYLYDISAYLSPYKNHLN